MGQAKDHQGKSKPGATEGDDRVYTSSVSDAEADASTRAGMGRGTTAELGLKRSRGVPEQGMAARVDRHLDEKAERGETDRRS